METVTLLQIVFSVVIFLSTMLFTLLPSRLLPKDSQVVLSPRIQRAVSLCNCLSGGIFLGTCNLQMVPYIEAKFRRVLESRHLGEDMNCRLTQLILMVGFFFVLIIDVLVHKCQRHPATNYTPVVDNGIDMEGTVTSQEDVALLHSLPPEQDATSTATDSQHTHPTDNGHIPAEANHTHSSNGDAHSSHGHAHSVNSHAHSSNGHAHCESGHEGHSHLLDIAEDNIGVRCLLLLAALSIHSVFEGLALGLQENVHQLTNLFIGVLLHEVFVAFAMGISLAKQHFRMTNVLKLSLTLSAMIPVGMYVGMTIGIVPSWGGELASVLIQGVAAGTFIYVVFVEILPGEMNESRDRLLKVLFLFIGLVIMICLSFSLK
ncbi:hypothetical protein NP493_517g01021 [Ridgeia piscesae]|uniref:Zinc transporter ZIP3 n=1 Tax=Ridgeia piscesae TaxID=27915 RepID=A0AAD9NQH6_RIDPI|nr:hypothetical protein NP493_517g01021 [Ridgeia piscesae]